MAKDDFSQPVPPDNQPRRRRPPQPADEPASQPASEAATNVANKQATPQADVQAEPLARLAPTAPQLTVRRQLTSTDLMHGPADPEADLHQSGVRLPKYVIDAMRVVVATSRGQWNMQSLVREAVKAFLPPETVADAWRSHGGRPPG